MTRIRKHVFVTGTVQGVFFRARTRERAQEENVDGWVKNLADGRVEAVFEGSEAAVDAMVEFCHHGSERAQVEDVRVSGQQPAGADGFEIRRS